MRLLPAEPGLTILFCGGRLASWHRLVETWPGNPFRHPASQQHVELMLQIARQHNLQGISGYRLLSPQQSWSHCWTIGFPTLEGAERWMEAEMEASYGSHGFYDYQLTRRVGAAYFDGWVPAASRTVATTPPSVDSDQDWSGDPTEVPILQVDGSSIVVLCFERKIADSGGTAAAMQHLRLTAGAIEGEDELRNVARTHRLQQIQVYQMVCPTDRWSGHRCWVVRFPSLEGAEAWIAALTGSAQRARCYIHTVHLSRRHAPQYFDSWAQTGQFSARAGL
eukprot:SAG31_NODE_17_length_35773_cov_25.999271_6_plen_279_part_00